jgi:hypothetical protein
MVKTLQGDKMAEKCVHCGRKLVYSEELQKSADRGERDVGNCIIIDGWYCPVCDY